MFENLIKSVKNLFAPTKPADAEPANAAEPLRISEGSAYGWLFNQLNTPTSRELMSIAVGTECETEEMSQVNIPPHTLGFIFTRATHKVELIGWDENDKIRHATWIQPDDFLFLKAFYRASALYQEIEKRNSQGRIVIGLDRGTKMDPLFVTSPQQADSTAALLLGILIDEKKFAAMAPQVLGDV